jgi:branched-chain amino acid transport system substrate-binding protein
MKAKKRPKLRRAALVRAALVLIPTILVSCARPTIKIGFLGALTGKLSDLGVSGRDGAALAVAEANEKGGLLGRKVELVAEDDKQEAPAAVEAFGRLKSAGVVAIVGPMTSDVALAVLPGANAAKIPLVSPTASTPKLTGIDDYFLRVNPPDASEASSLAAFAAKAGYARVAVFYDESNRSFSEGTFQGFEKSLAELRGGAVTVTGLPFTSSPALSFAPLVKGALAARPNAILIVAGTADTAGIAQQLAKAGYRGALYGTGWAMTDELVRNGGSSVEGMAFSHYFDQGSSDPAWTAFVAGFERRFGRKPDFLAGLGYTAARVIIDSIAREGNAGDPRGAILKIGRFRWLQGGLAIDRFGDADLERFRIVVKSGTFVAEGR